MVDDSTNNWYRSKSKAEREQIRNEVRAFLRARKLSEQDSDPELAAIRSKRESAAARLSELHTKLEELQAELAAWDARIQELEAREKKARNDKYAKAREEARQRRKNPLLTKSVGDTQ